MQRILKYPGAKNRLAGWICSYIPQHGVYVEPYAGSLAVFFNKSPCRIETINDMDDNVVNYFRVLRETPGQLAHLLSLTPYSREEYYRAYNTLPEDTDVERARKFAVRCWMGFGCSNHYRNGFRSSQQSSSPHTTKEWGALPERLIKASARLLNAQIENLPALELIQRYNTPDVFMYIDPPYLPGTRKTNLYRHEMSRQDHIELLEALRKHKGKILISGYDNPLYNAMLPGWNKASVTTQAEGGTKRTETLWFNHQAGQIELALT